MNLVEYILILLAVGTLAFFAGCGVLDMADTALRAWRRRARGSR